MVPGGARGAAREPGAGRYVFRDGKGPDGAEPPTNWVSQFGGPAWTRVPDGEWYLHLFTPEQPDLNWERPEVREEFHSILRFWLDRGVDGFRIDVAHGMAKAPGLPDMDPALGRGTGLADSSAQDPRVDNDSVHEIHQMIRSVLEVPGPDRHRRGLGRRRRPVSPATCGRTSCTWRSTSGWWAPRSTRPRCATRSSTRWPRWPGWAHRRPGRCPTTTWSGT